MAIKRSRFIAQAGVKRSFSQVSGLGSVVRVFATLVFGNIAHAFELTAKAV